MRTDEAIILAHLDRHTGRGLEGTQCRRQTPFAAFRHHHLPDGQIGQASMQFAGDRSAAVRIIDPDIANPHPAPLQTRREFAHGRKHEGQLLLVVFDIGRLVPDLGHQDHVLRRIQIAQR